MESCRFIGNKMAMGGLCGNRACEGLSEVFVRQAMLASSRADGTSDVRNTSSSPDIGGQSANEALLIR